MTLHNTGFAIFFAAMLALTGCGDTEGGDGGTNGGGGSGGGGMSSSCEETGSRCENNILYDCFTDEVLRNCRTCQYVGPGTGSEYDTTCKDEQSDCGQCTAQDPWNGAGCYFGGGPAVCKP